MLVAIQKLRLHHQTLGKNQPGVSKWAASLINVTGAAILVVMQLVWDRAVRRAGYKDLVALADLYALNSKTALDTRALSELIENGWEFLVHDQDSGLAMAVALRIEDGIGTLGPTASRRQDEIERLLSVAELVCLAEGCTKIQRQRTCDIDPDEPLPDVYQRLGYHLATNAEGLAAIKFL